MELINLAADLMDFIMPKNERRKIPPYLVYYKIDSLGVHQVLKSICIVLG